MTGASFDRFVVSCADAAEVAARAAHIPKPPAWSTPRAEAHRLARSRGSLRPPPTRTRACCPDYFDPAKETSFSALPGFPGGRHDHSTLSSDRVFIGHYAGTQMPNAALAPEPHRCPDLR